MFRPGAMTDQLTSAIKIVQIVSRDSSCDWMDNHRAHIDLEDVAREYRKHVEYIAKILG